MEIQEIAYLNEEGQLSESCPLQLGEETLLKIYKTMLLTRMVDERMVTLQRQGLITFAMSAYGEEACAVASAAALESEDWLYPQYREAGILFWRDFPVVDYVHHMFGTAKDLILGRQMPNHFGSRAHNIVTVSSPIGTKIPHAAGSAYGMKLKGEKSCTVCYFGEGTTSEGDFHTGLNFAAVRHCPVIFFCRNNGYAISTPASSQFSSKGVAVKGEGYGIEAFRVDGNDVFAIYDMMKRARTLCLEGKGPILIEAMTYRLGAHSTSDDPTRYREEEEVKVWEKKCPLRRLRLYLEGKGLWNEERQAQCLDDLQQEISAAIEEAKAVPPPPLESLIEDVYFDVPLSLREQLKEVEGDD